MFGLVADDELYLKTDKDNVSRFEERGLGAFEFVAKGKTSTMSYFLAPEEIYDDPAEAKYWAELGFQAALRADEVKRKRLVKKKNKKKVDKLKRLIIEQNQPQKVTQ